MPRVIAKAVALAKHPQRTLVPALALLCLSCGKVYVAYLPTDAQSLHQPTTDVIVYWREPDRPYEIIGRISAESRAKREEKAFRKLRERAAEEGADAIIVTPTGYVGSTIGLPEQDGGTLMLPTGRIRIEALAIHFLK